MELQSGRGGKIVVAVELNKARGKFKAYYATSSFTVGINEKGEPERATIMCWGSTEERVKEQAVELCLVNNWIDTGEELAFLPVVDKTYYRPI